MLEFQYYLKSFDTHLDRFIDLTAYHFGKNVAVTTAKYLFKLWLY